MSSSTVQQISKPGAGASLVDILNYQDALIRAAQYEFLGRMKLLVVDASEGASVPGVGETSQVGVRFDWRNEPGPDGTGYVENFIPIGQSFDRQMLLTLAPVVRRDGRVGLPDIPDPSWVPGMLTPEQIAPPMVKDPQRGWIVKDTGVKFSPGSPPMIPQPLEQRGVQVIQGTEILVAQPVHQIMFQPEIGGGLAATYWSILGETDPGTRTKLAFLVDRRTGAAHFFGGRFTILKPRGEF
jgi:hypothetical protein